MQLCECIPPEHVLLGVEASDKWQLLSLMAETVVRRPDFAAQSSLGLAEVREAIFRREKEKPTVMEKELAFPHARLSDFAGLTLCLAVLKKPLDFEVPNLPPVRIACLILSPEKRPAIALKAMAQMGRFLTDDATRRELFTADKTDRIVEMIHRMDLAVDAPLLARDIMREPRPCFHPDLSLRKVVREMYVHQIEAVAVADERRTMLGEITCDRLFQFGLPDFFHQLKSVSFIKQFDPFEKYFEQEARARAADVMGPYAAVDENATLLEIVFSLVVKGHPKIYVLREGKLVGLIDRSVVLDRVVNY